MTWRQPKKQYRFKYWNLTDGDLNHTLCYKYDKNEYFADKCIESLDNAVGKYIKIASVAAGIMGRNNS